PEHEHLLERQPGPSGHEDDLVASAAQKGVSRQSGELPCEAEVEKPREAAHRPHVRPDAAREELGARLIELPEIGSNEAIVQGRQVWASVSWRPRSSAMRFKTP